MMSNPVKWRTVVTKSAPQQGFFRNSCCFDEENSRVFIFGGEDDNNMFQKRAFLLDLTTMTWVDLTMRLKDSIQIDSHTCVRRNGCFYVFGGNDSSTDFETLTIYKIKVTPYGIDIERIFDENTTEDLPVPRREHISELIKTDKFGEEMLIYGGRSRIEPKKVLADCWAFSFKTKEWRLISTDFPPRCCHSSAYDTENNRIFIFGGRNEKHLYCNDTFELSLNTPSSSFEVNFVKSKNLSNISKRELSTCNVFDNKLFISCGWAFGQAMNDIWSLELSEESEHYLQWRLFEDKISKIKRRGHSSFVFEDKLFLLGGKALRNANDLVSVRLK